MFFGNNKKRKALILCFSGSKKINNLKSKTNFFLSSSFKGIILFYSASSCLASLYFEYQVQNRWEESGWADCFLLKPWVRLVKSIKMKQQKKWDREQALLFFTHQTFHPSLSFLLSFSFILSLSFFFYIHTFTHLLTHLLTHIIIRLKDMLLRRKRRKKLYSNEAE